MGTSLTHQHIEQNNEPITIKRTERPYHHLYSPRDQHRQYVWKTWKYHNCFKAQQQLKKLHNKKKNPNQYIISVTDVQYTKASKKDVYKIRAKIEYSQKNLKTLLEAKKTQKNNFNLIQIWEMVTKLSLIAIQAKNLNIRLPQNMSNYLVFSNKIKIQDCQLLPEIRFDRKQVYNFKVIISRIVVNLALLTLKLGQVDITQINRVNIKYNANLATFIYCLKQQVISEEQCLKLCSRLKQQNSIQQMQRPLGPCKQQLQRQTRTICTSTHSLKAISDINTKTGQPSDKQYTKSSSEQTLVTLNMKRIQQIKPKSFHSKQPKFTLISLDLAKTYKSQEEQDLKQNLQINKKVASVKLNEQNKQNILNVINKDKGQQPKNSIDIDNHQFPKKLKLFKRSSITLSEANSYRNQQSSKSNSQLKNEAFIKMTGGSKCDLFNESSNEQLLQSIIQSEQSIIIKQGDSPMLQIDHDIDLITQDFFKLQFS